LQRRPFMFPAAPPMQQQPLPPRSCKDHRKSSRHLRNSNGERIRWASAESRRATLWPARCRQVRVRPRHGFQKSLLAGISCSMSHVRGELVDALDRQDANSSRPILKEWAYEMDEEGMPL